MKQKYKNIQETKEFCYKKIKEANETLAEMREKCDHPEEYIEIVDYMWAPGHISSNTKMCGICGEVIQIVDTWVRNEGFIHDGINPWLK